MPHGKDNKDYETGGKDYQHHSAKQSTGETQDHQDTTKDSMEKYRKTTIFQSDLRGPLRAPQRTR